MLVDPHAELLGGRLQAPRQARRIDDRRPVLAPEPTDVGGGVHLATHRLLVEQLDVLAERGELVVVLAQLVELVRRGGDVDDTRALEVAVDA